MEENEENIISRFEFKNRFKTSSNDRLPIPREEFYPARHYFNTPRADVGSLAQTLELHSSTQNRRWYDVPLESEITDIFPSQLKLVTKPDGKLDYFVHTKVIEVVEQKRTKEAMEEIKKQKPRRRRKTKAKTEPETQPPFQQELMFRNNSFLFAKAMIHPILKIYPFAEVAFLLSALWNDLKNCEVSDYFSFLTKCTAVSPSRVFDLPPIINLHDYSEFKISNGPYTIAIKDLIRAQAIALRYNEEQARAKLERSKSGRSKGSRASSSKSGSSFSRLSHHNKFIPF